MTLTLELPPEIEGALAEEAQRQGTTPEQIVLDDLRQRYAEDYAADQQRRHIILAGLIAKAQERVPGQRSSSTRQSYRDSPIDEIIVEKFRRQDFNL